MIIITGASGYLGSHITRRLSLAGYPVRALVYNLERAHRENRLEGLDIEIVQADVTNESTLLPAFKKGTAIIHTVAIAIEKGNRTYEEINFRGTVNVVEAAKVAGIQRFINISQLGADAGLPFRFLASKGKAQEYVAQSGLKWTAFRPSVIWGPEDEFANTFAKLVSFSPIIFPIIGDENSKFQPVWVEDLVTCVFKSLEDSTTVGKELEIGGPEILTLEEIERRTLKAIGANRKFIPLPMMVIRFVVMLMEKFLPNPPVTNSLLELLQVSNVTTDNAISQFVDNPRPFTAEYAASYMRKFSVGETIRQFMGK